MSWLKDQLRFLFMMDKPEVSYELPADAKKEPMMELLRRNADVRFAQDCLAAMENGRELKTPTLSSNAQATKDISERRAAHVRRLGLPIYGLDEIFANLEHATVDRVVIHDVSDKGYLYLIYTDEETEILFGIVAMDRYIRWRKPDTIFGKGPQSDDARM